MESPLDEPYSPWQLPQTTSVRPPNKPRSKLRRAMWLANCNAALWAVGNGLVSTLLITYLAIELGAQGLAISLILAAPKFAGLLRLGTPALIARVGDRKLVCLVGYLASGCLLWLLPWLAVPGGWISASGSISALVACWSIYHLLEYVATIALWSWLGDWMPGRVRGRLIGRREQWLLIGRVVGIGASITLSICWGRLAQRFGYESPAWEPLAWSALIGATFMLLALLPLLFLPRCSPRCLPQGQRVEPTSWKDSWQATLTAMADPAYRRLLAYSCWLAMANGLTSAAQSMYPARVLGFSYHQVAGMKSALFAGQSLVAPVMGSWIDRWGARPVMVVGQLLVATGPLFFYLATPEYRWWVAGAFLAWIAYASLNVGLDSLKLQLAPTGNNAPHLAVYYAVSGLASGLTLVIAGTYWGHLDAGGPESLRLYATLFLAGWVARSLGTLLIWRIPDRSPPGLAYKSAPMPLQSAATDPSPPGANNK